MIEVRVRKLTFLAGVLLTAHVAVAGRPLVVDDADPVDFHQFEFEAGVAYEYDSGSKFWEFPFGLTYGLFPAVEAGVGFGGLCDEAQSEIGIGDLSVGAKWQVAKSCPLGARHAVVPSVKFPTADDEKDLGSGETDYSFTWIASRSIGERTGVHLNLGYSWIGGEDDNMLHYGVALDYRILDAIQWVGEGFACKELAHGAETDVMCNTGLRWNPLESLTLDIAAGAKIAGDAPDFIATAGLTWAFGFNNNQQE